MRIPEKSPTGKKLTNMQMQSSPKRVAAVFATLALAIVCVFTGMLAAITATAPNVSLPGCADGISSFCTKGIYISYASDSSSFACGGECPGVCPCPYAFEGRQ
jgi:hypothetical protein